MQRTRILCAVTLAAVSACSADVSPPGGAGENGGMAQTGSTTGTGGTLASGGKSAAGGTAGAGPVAAGRGGTTAGAGGTLSTGGSTAVGGATSVGGATAMGGSTAAGGAAASAGATRGGRSNGGTTSLGGMAGMSVAGGSAGSGAGGTDSNPGVGCTPPTAYANLFVTVSGQTQADSDAKVAAAWTKLFTPSGSGSIYFNGPGADESYVEDTYNNDVRTEGMSYGMMVAVQLDHQTEFDRMWAFVKAHMAQGTGQIAWHVSTFGLEVGHGRRAGRRRVLRSGARFAHTAGATRPGSTRTRPKRSGCST